MVRWWWWWCAGNINNNNNSRKHKLAHIHISRRDGLLLLLRRHRARSCSGSGVLPLGPRAVFVERLQVGDGLPGLCAESMGAAPGNTGSVGITVLIEKQ